MDELPIEKQRFKCHNCGRQFVESPTRQPINHSTRELIDKLLLERVSLAAIARVTGVSLRWLQYYVNQKYYQVPKSVEVTKKKPGRLMIQMDEMWSYVGSKANKQWIWLAIDETTREIVGVHIGDRKASISKTIMAISTAYLSTMCNLLHRFWGSIRTGFTQ